MRCQSNAVRCKFLSWVAHDPIAAVFVVEEILASRKRAPPQLLKHHISDVGPRPRVHNHDKRTKSRASGMTSARVKSTSAAAVWLVATLCRAERITTSVIASWSPKRNERTTSTNGCGETGMACVAGLQPVTMCTNTLDCPRSGPSQFGPAVDLFRNSEYFSAIIHGEE